MGYDDTETIQHKGYDITLWVDEHAESPREWDNMGTMVCFHKRYDLGDKHEYTMDELNKLVQRPKIISLPLYLYDHSGLTISTSPFSCPWDSGQVGYIFVSPSKVRKDMCVKVITDEVIAKAKALLQSEVDMYDAYVRGSVCGYTVQKEGRTVDSVGGYYSHTSALDDAFAAVAADIQSEGEVTEHLNSAWAL
jgi:hypothetical protein